MLSYSTAPAVGMQDGKQGAVVRLATSSITRQPPPVGIRTQDRFSAAWGSQAGLMGCTPVSILGGSVGKAAWLSRGTRGLGEVWSLLPKNREITSSSVIFTCRL